MVKGNPGKQVKPPASRGKISNGGKGGFKTDAKNKVPGARSIAFFFGRLKSAEPPLPGPSRCASPLTSSSGLPFLVLRTLKR